MLNEITHRWIFFSIQIVVGLVIQKLYLTNLTLFALSTQNIYQSAYWLGLPAISFVVLALVPLARREGQFRVSGTGMWCSAIGGYLSIVMPATALWFTTGDYYHGGGANIGVAILVVAMPVYMPVFMAIGFIVGESLHGPKKDT